MRTWWNVATVRIPVALGAMALLAGCLGPAPGPAVHEPQPEVGSFSFEDLLTGCDGAIAAFFLEPERAARFLPPGFVPADANTVLPSPVPTGRTIVGLYAAQCRSSELNGAPFGEAEVLIAVQPPDLGDHDPGPAPRHFYIVAQYLRARVYVDRLGPLGYGAVDAVIETRVRFGPAGSGSAHVTDAAGQTLAFETALAPAPASDASTGSRFWRETLGGITYYDTSFEMDHLLGPLAACRLRPGSPAHAVLSAEDCSAMEAVVFLLADQDFPYEFHYLADVHARPVDGRKGEVVQARPSAAQGEAAAERGDHVGFPPLLGGGAFAV